ncbi:hypothetical protein DFH28DRAFT_899858, partial [Melampsora americana]
LNVQHNCHDAQCKVANTRSFRIEQTEARHKRPEVTHQAFNSFIINAGSHYASEYHRGVTQHVWSAVTPAEWQRSIDRGLLAWFERCPPKGVGNNPVDDSVHEDDDQLSQGHMSLNL